MNMTEIQPTSVTLMWDLGATNVRNSSVLHYVDAQLISWRTTTTINSLTGLTPRQTYAFYLYVHSFDKTAHSMTHGVTTCELIVGLGLGFVGKLDSNIRPLKYLNIQILLSLYCCNQCFIYVADRIVSVLSATACHQQVVSCLNITDVGDSCES